MKNAQEVQDYLWRRCGSHEAAREFLRLDLGPDLFWPALRKVWSGFDLIPTAAMVREMNRRSEWWEPCSEWLALPQTFTAYRGQDASRDGICWSRDREVAERFSLGYRGVRNPQPLLRELTLTPEQVAMVIGDRDEAEVVTWRPH